MLKCVRAIMSERRAMQTDMTWIRTHTPINHQILNFDALELIVVVVYCRYWGLLLVCL